jgi:hypothetical protein
MSSEVCARADVSRISDPARGRRGAGSNGGPAPRSSLALREEGPS